jgi:hypothetical protein
LAGIVADPARLPADRGRLTNPVVLIDLDALPRAALILAFVTGEALLNTALAAGARLLPEPLSATVGQRVAVRAGNAAAFVGLAEIAAAAIAVVIVTGSPRLAATASVLGCSGGVAVPKKGIATRRRILTALVVGRVALRL